MHYRYTPQQLAQALGRPQPTAEQASIIAADLTPRLVVAGAGSGKTATMVDRVVFLVANGIVSADQVLGLTFTRKAAAELRERMSSRLEQLRRQGMLVETDRELPVTDPSVSTYHSYAQTLVDHYGLRLGIEEDSQLLGAAQSWQLLAQIVQRLNPEQLPDTLPAKETIIRDSLKLASECSEHLLEPEKLIAWCHKQAASLAAVPLVGRNKGAERNKLIENLKLRAFYAQLVQTYTSVKQSMQVMDYGDLIAQAARIAAQIPQAAQTERDRYRVVLLDEFQDTSYAQLRLFSDLYGAVAGKTEHPVMAVGDPKQSIYGFRGASDGQLFSFYDFFPTQDRTASYLTTAWRNDTAILQAANRIAQPLKKQASWVLQESQVEIPDLQARPNPGSGYLALGRYATDQEEATAIAEHISGIYSQQSGHKKPSLAILCKKRSQMQTLAHALEEAGLPYHIVGLGGLLDTPEVVDMLAVLRVLTDPGRSDALMRILAGARWRLGPADLLALADWAGQLSRDREQKLNKKLLTEYSQQGAAGQAREKIKEITAENPAEISQNASLIEALENLPDPAWVSAQGRSLTAQGYRRLEALAAELAWLRQFLADDLTALLTTIEQTILLDIELEAKPGANWSTSRRNLDAFYEVAAQYARSAPRMNATLLAGAQAASAAGTARLPYTLGSAGGSVTGVSGFLAWLDAAAAQEAGLELAAAEPEPGLVQLLTVHAAKGLEWDWVYLPGMRQGDFPMLDDPRWSQNAHSVPWPLRGDRNFLPGWRHDFEDIADFTDYMKDFKEQASQHRVNEERRLAYVGFTRARLGLVLSNSVWQGSKVKPAAASEFWQEILAENPTVLSMCGDDQAGQTNPQSVSLQTALWPFDPLDGPLVQRWQSVEELNEALKEGNTAQQGEQPAGPGRRQLQEAAASVLQGGLEQPVAAATSQQVDSQGPLIEDWYREADLLLALLFSKQEQWEFRLPEHVSVSQMVGLAADPEAVLENMLRPMPQKPSSAARQGTMFHDWVQSRLENSAQLELADLAYADQALDAALDLPRLQKNFLASRWGQLQPWAVEYPLETPVAGITVRGRIDAIYCHREAAGRQSWELVDWKTGSMPAPGQREAKTVQLALYRLAFARLQQLDPADISCTFFYVGQNKVWTPEQLLDEQGLRQLLIRARKLAQA